LNQLRNLRRETPNELGSPSALNRVPARVMFATQTVVVLRAADGRLK